MKHLPATRLGASTMLIAAAIPASAATVVTQWDQFANSGITAAGPAMDELIAACEEADAGRRAALERAGVRFIGTETHEGGVALPELLDDLAALGMASVLVEGGAAVAKAFLADDLVDRIVIFQGPEAIGPEGIASPVDAGSIPAGFRKLREMRFGDDTYAEWIRDI
mgnify:CR=1 FL=1